MEVKELIAELLKLDQDKEIKYYADDYTDDDICSIGKVTTETEEYYRII